MKIDWKKLGLNLLYPHVAVIICLLPISVAVLILSLIYLDSTSILAIISYLLAFYVLLVICFRLPIIIQFFKTFKSQNKYAKKWFSDVHLRMNVSLYGSLIWNVAFAIFQLVLGFHHKSFWYYTMFAYYFMLGTMRLFVVSHTTKHKANEQKQAELKRYTIIGWILLFMNIALAIILFFMVHLNKTVKHHEITTIAIASYTFLTFTFAIINLFRYKKYNSPAYSSAKIISLISGSVSILTLENTMLATFGQTESASFRKLMLTLTGIAVIGFVIFMSIFMIKKGNKELKVYSEDSNKNQN